MIDKKNEKKSSTRIPLKFDCTQIEHVYLEFSVYQQYTSPRDLFVVLHAIFTFPESERELAMTN